jgi:hypothetical protein
MPVVGIGVKSRRDEEPIMSDTVMAVEAVEHPSATQPRGERGQWGERPRTLKQQSARLQAAFVHTLTEADVEAIARKLIEQARGGDNTSARLVLKHGLGQMQSPMATDWTLQEEAKAAARTPRPATPPAEPTAEQVMATIRAKVQEQEALQADILRMGGAAPKPGAERRPNAAPVGPGQGKPPGSAGR